MLYSRAPHINKIAFKRCVCVCVQQCLLARLAVFMTSCFGIYVSINKRIYICSKFIFIMRLTDQFY